MNMSLYYIAFAFSLACYTSSGSLYVQQFFKQSSSLIKYAQPLLMLALIGHLGILVISTQQHTGEQLSLAFVATMLAWLVTLTMFITHKFIRNLLFLPVVCFVSAFIILIDLFFPATTGISVNMSVGMIMHILLSLVAFGLLSISMLYACQLAYIKHQLKQKSRIMIAGHLPPLQSVERILMQLMTIGTVLLLTALVSGFIFIPNMFAEGYAHKTILSSIALCCYVACILLHHFIGLRARMTIIFNLFGLFLLTLGYFGSRVVKEVLLS
ncbi:MAG: ABC-type uncharacterized transport system permease subunit [Kangiellaceae bacterium]|jgi:ABC-type uncharacterized transport system permease subunit